MSFTYDDFANGQWDPAASTLGAVAALSDTLQLTLVDTALYVADQAADTNFADIAGGAIIATQTVTGVTVLTRALTFDPVVYPALVGADWQAAVLWKDTGTPSTSPLIAYLDDYDSPPASPDGTDYTWNPPAGGVITL